jgi:carbohydrate diacid regulator
MHILDARLAQEIVSRTMRIIPFNVNVMDAHGVILASGNPARVGELHAGALLALRTLGPVDARRRSAE